MCPSRYLSILALSVFSCASTSVAADLAQGKTLFSQRCASCHGELGAGDGPVAQGLPADQKPRNLTSGQMKFATDGTKLKKLLKEGGQSVGLSILMPPQPDLKDDDLDAVVAYVQSLKK